MVKKNRNNKILELFLKRDLMKTFVMHEPIGNLIDAKIMPGRQAPCQSEGFCISTIPDKVIVIASSVLGEEYVPFVIEVKNNLNKAIFYKVKVTSNYLFRISKPSGILESGEIRKLEVNVRPKFGVPRDEDNHHLNIYYTFKPDNFVIPKTGHFSIRSAWREIEARNRPIEFRMFALTFLKPKTTPNYLVELPQKQHSPLYDRGSSNLDDQCLKMWIKTESNIPEISKCELDLGRQICNKPSSRHEDKLRSWILHRSYGICCDEHCEQFSDEENEIQDATVDSKTSLRKPRLQPHTLDAVLSSPHARNINTALYRRLLEKHDLKPSSPSKLP